MGRVLTFNSPTGTLLVDVCWKAPTSPALDSTAGQLYITSRAEGKVYKVDVGK